MAEVNVHNLGNLQRAFAAAGKEANRTARATLREVAEPTKRDAESTALSSIRRIGPRWYRMRIGVTRTGIYVAPQQRGVKGTARNRQRRPKFGRDLERLVMTPTLNRQRHTYEQRMVAAFDKLADDWNRKG